MLRNSLEQCRGDRCSALSDPYCSAQNDAHCSVQNDAYYSAQNDNHHSVLTNLPVLSSTDCSVPNNYQCGCTGQRQSVSITLHCLMNIVQCQTMNIVQRWMVILCHWFQRPMKVRWKNTYQIMVLSVSQRLHLHWCQCPQSLLTGASGRIV
jgi:hypothetical protein